MRVTIQKIAHCLSVSPATVSRVLNGREDAFISQATRQRVLATAREMGYETNWAARALATGRTHLIAFWMPRLYEPFYASFTHHLHDQVKRHDFEMIVSVMGDRVDWRPNESRVTRWPVDGILACDFLGTEQAFRQAVERTPCVSVGSYYLEGIHFVGIDLYAGAVKAIQHLLASGRKRVAFFTPTYGTRVGDARHDAYTAVIEQAGLMPQYIVTSDHRRATCRHVLREYVASHGHPEALFCRNDDMAIGAYRALRDLGLNVPGDVALVGCDGIEDTEYLDVPITTIAQPIEQMCALAWEFLERCMNDPSCSPQQRLLEPQLIIRASSQ